MCDYVQEEEWPATAADLDRACCFASGERVLLTSGIHDSFTGIAPGQLLSHLSQLRRQGMTNPVAIGAIPFDTRAPWHLVIPEQWQWIARERLLPACHCQLHGKVCEVTDAAHYQGAVREALQQFSEGQLEKIVLSRAIDVQSAQRTAPSQAYGSLLAQNPGAYVFQVPLPEGETLLGASPELLISRNDMTVVSNPLAGSRPRHAFCEQQAACSDLLQARKDRYEHALVADAVAAALSPFCRELEVPVEPQVIATSTMWHLSTRIEGRLREPSTALELALALHPTPAVCGTPQEEARQAIARLEGYDRHFYSGAVGWMDADGNGEWVVTIRCGMLAGKTLRLYAGAGVVVGSSPEAEWQETAAKLGTMLRAFGLESREPEVAA
ncbi:isochorismate synthase [Aeromonas enteropelogenes]|uniref:isochorismate synthase n=1 Tax=Aeromonas enteropelogenes TaxID=29489 RepID=UPI00191F820B|nr:isochorismate synthase [Aeromonas enteropelogenes]MBL0520067.1 isochorismate synthase [Aeromonas enteropelogenes]